jgi:hypothetical protein
MRDVNESVLAFNEEMMVLGHVRIEIGFRAVDSDLAQQSDVGELMQRVVDGRQRYRHLCLDRLFVKHFSGRVSVTPAEQYQTQCDALPQPAWTTSVLPDIGVILSFGNGRIATKPAHGCGL